MQEFIEQASQIDTMESAYKELSRSLDYADETLFTTEQLEKKKDYWSGELDNPLRSERNLLEVQRIVDLLDFEIKVRCGGFSSLDSL